MDGRGKEKREKVGSPVLVQGKKHPTYFRLVSRLVDSGI